LNVSLPAKAYQIRTKLNISLEEYLEYMLKEASKVLAFFIS